MQGNARLIFPIVVTTIIVARPARIVTLIGGIA